MMVPRGPGKRKGMWGKRGIEIHLRNSGEKFTVSYTSWFPIKLAQWKAQSSFTDRYDSLPNYIGVLVHITRLVLGFIELWGADRKAIRRYWILTAMSRVHDKARILCIKAQPKWRCNHKMKLQSHQKMRLNKGTGKMRNPRQNVDK